jgi:hypothetical protein
LLMSHHLYFLAGVCCPAGVLRATD